MIPLRRNGYFLLGLTLIGLLTAWPAASVRAADALPPDLALVPGDAIGFVHVHVKALLQTEAFRDVRELLQKAGPKILQAFDKRFVPAPSSIERLTVFMLTPSGQAGREPDFVFVVTTSTPYDADKLIKGTLPMSQPMKAGDTTYHVDERGDVALCTRGDRTFMFGPVIAVKRYLESVKQPAGTLQAALEAAAKKHFLLCVNLALQAPGLRGEVPPPLQPLLDSQLLTLSAHIEKDLALDVQLQFPDAEKATAGEQSVKMAIAMAQGMLADVRNRLEMQVLGPNPQEQGQLRELPEAAAGVMGLAFVGQYEEILRTLPLERKGTNLQVAVRIAPGPASSVAALSGLAAGMLVPAVQKVRMAAERMSSTNNLKQMALAMHNYHDTYNKLPSAAICDKDGKPLLSWRVAILPFIEEQELYKRFKLDEPWDSEHNRKLISLMPKIYAMPNAPQKGEGTTYYRVFAGGGAMFEVDKGTRLAEILDGTSNTLMIVEAAEAVPWTKPEELAYDPQKPLPKLGGHAPGGFNAAFADGSVRFLRSKLAEDVIRAIITRGGGEVVNIDE